MQKVLELYNLASVFAGGLNLTQWFSQHRAKFELFSYSSG